PSGVFARVPDGFRIPVIPHSRLPSRLPGPWTASIRSWIWLVRTTRPSRLRLIGPRSRLRIEQALPAGSGGSGSGTWLACAGALALLTAAGRLTFSLVTFLEPSLP